MQVIICDVCHRGVDPAAPRVYGQLTVQSAMGLGAQAIDAHLSCYERLMGLLVDESKAELPHVWREGDPDDVTVPVDPATAIPPPVDPTQQPIMPPLDPAQPPPGPVSETPSAEEPLPAPGAEQPSPEPTGPDVGTDPIAPEAPEAAATAPTEADSDPPADPATPEATDG